MSTPQYAAYKDSGVEWLGSVPKDWNVLPLKAVATCNDEVLPEVTDRDTVIEYVEISGVEEGLGITQTDTLTFGSAPSRARRVVRHGDVLISTVRTYLRAIASVSHPPENLIASTGFAAIRPRRVHPGYLGYLLHCEYLISEVIARSVGISYPAINASDLMGLKGPIPTIEEQQAIATFLDRETTKIDALVAEQQHLIELLKERRQAAISQAVTKGLDPSARMKDSGVEWLGAVPEHWNLLATKRLFRVVADPAPDDNEYELLSIYTAIGVRPRQDLEQRGNRATTQDGYWMVRKGDLIVNKLLAWMGAIGVSDYDGVTSPAYDILRATVPLEPRFYDYLFRCGICFTEFRRYSRGIMDMRLRLYFDELGQLVMPFPPLDEQRRIVSHLQSEAGKFDALSDEAFRAIELLRGKRLAAAS